MNLKNIIIAVVLVLSLSFALAAYSPQAFAPNVSVLEIPNLQTPEAKKIVQSARSQIGIVTEYDGSYFPADQVPENSGVCTDVIARALNSIDYDLREKVEEDIAKNPNQYPSSPPLDSNINFRRVKILTVFLGKYFTPLTIQAIPGDIENLTNWQGGDIVTFAPLKSSGLEHIAIISDKRRADGLPLLIHNYGIGTQEDDYLLNWPAQITGHYRSK
ncbi:DUF1287 domain-containing protein [Patescibacteria group bacterium]|nr:DUF1287 domain-containing protein [Patescibacteria group bacterium]